MAGFSLGLSRFIPARSTGGGNKASPDATGQFYTATGLKAGSTAILYGNGTQIASTTVDSAGKATWTLGSIPAGGTIVTFDATITGSGGTVSGSAPAPTGGTLDFTDPANSGLIAAL